MSLWQEVKTGEDKIVEKNVKELWTEHNGKKIKERRIQASTIRWGQNNKIHKFSRQKET